ncbi:hypothetical protein UPTC15610_01451 [Campylobacter lari]
MYSKLYTTDVRINALIKKKDHTTIEISHTHWLTLKNFTLLKSVIIINISQKCNKYIKVYMNKKQFYK